MFTTIVVGTDGSKDAAVALRTASWFMQLMGDTELHVVNANRPLTPRELEDLKARLPEEMRPVLHANVGGDSTIADAKRILHSAGVDADYHQLHDDPTDAILSIVDRVGADLVIVGSRGEGLAKRALHGSVSTKVVHNAPCTVLVVKAER